MFKIQIFQTEKFRILIFEFRICFGFRYSDFGIDKSTENSKYLWLDLSARLSTGVSSKLGQVHVNPVIQLNQQLKKTGRLYMLRPLYFLQLQQAKVQTLNHFGHTIKIEGVDGIGFPVVILVPEE